MHIDLLLSRLLTGEATEAERAEIESWAAQSEDNARILESFKVLMAADVQEDRLIFSDNSFNKLQHRLQDHSGKVIDRANDRRFNIMRIAAAVVLMAMSIWIVRTFLYTPTTKLQYHAEYIVKSNPSGQRALIYLPDGSTLWLNAESSIRYEKNFHDSVRLLYLEGEAYFMVKKDTLKPFVVQAGNTLVTALGTAFNVEAYGASEAVNIALESGSVKVQKNDQSNDKGVLLHPGEMASVPRSDNMIRVNDFDAMNVLAWKEGVLYFKNAQFDEVIKRLERWYGVQFEYDRRPQKTWHFSGTFRNEYLENILETLAFGERLGYEIYGDTVKLKF